MRKRYNKRATQHLPHSSQVLAPPIFPDRLRSSIVGRNELNFRVRNGNGWTLALIGTYKLKAHDEENACGVGDTVKVMETRPLSKDKRWRVVEIVEKAK